jgi:hypothetical protein
VTCNLVNNKNWTVNGLWMCTVNVMLVLSEILNSEGRILSLYYTVTH